MNKTASDFADISVPGYGNINEIFLQKNQLHACETLFGDPNAEMMILAQDAADYKKFETDFLKTGINPYRHDASWPTNKNLFSFLKPFFNVGESVSNPNSKSCGVYYANAIWLLKKDGGAQGPIVNSDAVIRECSKVFEATIENLPNLKLIIALGAKAHEFLLFNSSGLPSSWRKAREDGPSICKVLGKEILIGCTHHTGARGIVNRAISAKKEGVIGSGSALLQNDFARILNKAGFERRF